MIKKLSILIIIGILFIAVLPSSSLAADNEITWYSYQEGMQKAESQDKPIFIDFWAQWCSPCQQMEENVYPNDDVIQKSSEFINIKVNVDQNSNLASEYNIQSIPTLLFLDSDGDIINRKVGYKSSSELINIMNSVLDSTAGSGDQTPTENEAQEKEEEPFWSSLIFIEIIISIFLAAGIIIFLSKTKKED